MPRYIFSSAATWFSMRTSRPPLAALSAAGPPEKHTSAAPPPGWPSVRVPRHVDRTIGERIGCQARLRQNRFLSAIRHFTFDPICGISVPGSSGSNAMRFHTLGGAVRRTCSASSTRPLASVTRASRSVTVTLRTGALVSTRSLPIARGQPARQLLIAAAAAIHLAVGPVLFEPAALDHRQVAQITLPGGDDPVVGRHHRVEPGLAERRRVHALDPRRQRPAVERLGVRRPPRLERVGDLRRVGVQQTGRLLELLPERL